MPATFRPVFIVLASLLYIAAGTLHFFRHELYLKIMPPYIPWPAAMVAISGVAEILGGFGLLVPSARRFAAWGLVALLVAVMPANIYMAQNRDSGYDSTASTVVVVGAAPGAGSSNLVAALVHQSSYILGAGTLLQIRSLIQCSSHHSTGFTCTPSTCIVK